MEHFEELYYQGGGSQHRPVAPAVVPGNLNPHPYRSTHAEYANLQSQYKPRDGAGTGAGSGTASRQLSAGLEAILDPKSWDSRNSPYLGAKALHEDELTGIL